MTKLILIKKSEVKKIMQLSSIACSENELSSYMKDLSTIVNIFDKLKDINAWINQEVIDIYDYTKLALSFKPA